MSITQLEAVSVWSKPPNVFGAVCFGFLDQVESWELVRRRDQTHAASISAPLGGNASALCIQRRILALHFAATTPGGTGEVVPLRISEASREQTADGLRVTVTARSLLFDWGDAGPMSYVYAGGKHEFAISGELDAQTWLNTYAIPHLIRQGYDWYTAFCANPLKIPRAFSRETPLQLANAAGEYLGHELLLSPIGGTWQLDVLPAVNSTLDPLRITVGRNVRRIRQSRASNEQATVLVPFGTKGHSELSRSVQPFVFASTAENLGTKELTALPFSDSAWTIPVVQMNGQWVDFLGGKSWYLQRVRTGRCFPIVETTAAAVAGLGGKFRLADLTIVPYGYLWALREGRTPGTEIDVPSPGFPLRVSGAPAGNVVTLVNPFSAADPVPTDDEHVDCRLRRSTLVLATTTSTVAAVAGVSTDVDVTCASTAGVQVGDWGFAHNNVGTPWTLFGKVFVVVQVISSTVVRVRKRYTFDTTAAPFSTGAMVKQLQFYRVQSGYLGYVNDEIAAANTVTMSTAAGLANNDLVEYCLDNSGAMITGLPSPLSAEPSVFGETYGIARKDKDFATARCCPNLAQTANPVFDDWPGIGLPNFWSGSCTKVTTNLPGPGIVAAAQLAGSSLHTITSPIFYARPTAGDSKLSIRVRLRTGNGAFWDGSTASHRTVIELLVGGTTTVLGSATIIPPGYPSPPANYVEVAPNTVVDVDLLAVDLLHTPGAGAKYAPWDGVQVRISTIFGGGTIVVGGFFATQDSTLPSDGFMSANGNSDLFGLGQLALDALEAPETTNDIDAFDLQRALGAVYSADEMIEGRTVRVEAEELGLAFEDRIDAVTYRGAQDGTTQVQVATRTRQFADVLANYLTAT